MSQRDTKTPREKETKRRYRVLKALHNGKVKGDLTDADAIQFVKEIMAVELEIPDA